jgi:hypothetical protein
MKPRSSPTIESYHKSFVAQKFHFERVRKIGDDLPGSPIENHEWPNWFETEKRYSVKGSLLHLNSQVVVVDDTLKGIFQRLDPRMHLFSPLRALSFTVTLRTVLMRMAALSITMMRRTRIISGGGRTPRSWMRRRTMC